MRLWDLGGGSTEDTPLSGHIGRVGALATGAIGGRAVVVSGADDGIVRVWDLADGSPAGEPMSGHTDWVRAVDVCEWGAESYAVSGSYDSTVRVWNIRTGTAVHVLADKDLNPVRALTTGTFQGRPIVFSCNTYKTVDVRDVVTGESLSHVPFRSMDALLAVTAANIADRYLIAFATYEDRLYVWTPERVKPLQFHFTAQRAGELLMELLDDGGRLLLATGDESGVLSVWRLPDPHHPRRLRLRRHLPVAPRRLATLRLPGPITAIMPSPDGTVTVAFGDTVVLDPFSVGMRIQLDARVRAMRFADPHTLIVSTVQGMVSIRLSEH